MFSRNRIPLTQMTARRIALIKPSALGDIVHSLPVLSALRRRFPQAHITWAINRSFEPLLAGHPDLDATLPVDRQAMKHGIRGALTAVGRLAHRLRHGRFDLVIDMQGLLRSGLMTAVTGATRRVGLGTCREGSRHFYTDIVPTPNGMAEHAVDRHWRVAEAFGVGDMPKSFTVPISPLAREWATQQLHDLPRPWLAFGIGATWTTKRWPPESFAVLAERVQARYGGSVLFVGGPSETPLVQQIINRVRGPVRDYTGKTSLPQLAGLLDRIDVMVSNDTGPLHLAAALGRPVVAPYLCTQKSRHGPYGSLDTAVESAIWCQGSYIKKCDRLECMAELHPDRLWYFLNETLDTWARRSRFA